MSRKIAMGAALALAASLAGAGCDWMNMNYDSTKNADTVASAPHHFTKPMGLKGGANPCKTPPLMHKTKKDTDDSDMM